ncbi:hypothetical protein AB0D08_32730 [Kitasatospora sp. NPDC048540]|uniref:hypothetical protein n=1 Tax=Kitasatospora sp. NPDC048540 TaxID=3155634 RepID=UPI0033CD902D
MSTTDLIAAAVLFGPGAVAGAFHARSVRGQRADSARVRAVLAVSAAERAALAEQQSPTPPPARESAPAPQPAPPVRLATVIDFPARRAA